MTTSLRSFLLDSVFLELISVAVLFDVFNKIAHLGNNSYDFIIQYVLIVLAITISWSIVSCMANNKVATLANYNVPLVKTQMKKIIVTAKTLYSHPKNVSKIYAALHTDLAW